MASIRTTQATETTAQAIARATESLDLMKSKDLSTNLRISNLEKQIRKQEQKINEKFKSSQKNKTTKTNNKEIYPR
jgi:3-polyprenyl-4-hydroxybenzoate decarboxylase